MVIPLTADTAMVEEFDGSQGDEFIEKNTFC